MSLNQQSQNTERKGIIMVAMKINLLYETEKQGSKIQNGIQNL